MKNDPQAGNSQISGETKAPTSEHGDAERHGPPDDGRFFYMIWVIFFGVALGVGGSLLENVQVSPMSKIFASGPFVIIALSLNKIVLLRRFSVAHMYIVASVIAIFTNYLGPPSPLKPLFILAGLSFDAGTLFRTHNLRYYNLVTGHMCSAVSGFGLSFLMTALLSWELARGLASVFLIVGGIYIVMIVPISWLVWKAIPVHNPPEIVTQIRATIGNSAT